MNCIRPLLMLFLLLPSAAFGGAVDLTSDMSVTSKDHQADILAQERTIIVLPEIASQVDMSSSDINRVACPADQIIHDVVLSKEKGVKVAYSGANAFIKFQIAMRSGQETYATKPVEMYVVCGDNIYNLIATPKRIPSQTIRLSSGKLKAIKQNSSLMAGLPMEKKALLLIRLTYTDNLPESFEITRPNKKFKVFQGLNLLLKKQVLVEGEGLTLKEFIASNDSNSTEPMRLVEKDFLVPELTMNTLAISMNKLLIKKGESARVFIVETTSEGGSISGYQKQN